MNDDQICAIFSILGTIVGFLTVYILHWCVVI